jgi:hypothetical protein
MAVETIPASAVRSPTKSAPGIWREYLDLCAGSGRIDCHFLGVPVRLDETGGVYDHAQAQNCDAKKGASSLPLEPSFKRSC